MKGAQIVIALALSTSVLLGGIGCTSKRSPVLADTQANAKPAAVGAVLATPAPPRAAPTPSSTEPTASAAGTYSALIIYLHSGGEMLLTDASGRRTGYNRANGGSWQEIPNSTYGEESIDALDDDASTDEKSLDLRPPAPGVYTLTVYDTREGAYDLELRATKGTELEPPTLIRDVPSSSGSQQIYTVTVPAGGSGAVAISPRTDAAKNRVR